VVGIVAACYLLLPTSKMHVHPEYECNDVNGAVVVRTGQSTSGTGGARPLRPSTCEILGLSGVGVLVPEKWSKTVTEVKR